MPAKSVTISDEIYIRVYDIAKDENKTTAKVMGEIVEVALDDDVYEKLFQLKDGKKVPFIEILKEIIKEGLK